jgi:hypothetical protein
MPPALRPASAADAADLAVFLTRAVRLDPGGLVRLRSGGGRLTAYLRLPFGVLVTRSAAGTVTPEDVTVGAADLLARLDAAPAGDPVPLPPARDAAWRGALPPSAGWQRLDTVPADAVRQVVRAGGDLVRSADVPGGAGDALLYQDALTVSGGGRTVVLPLRVLSAAWTMGFLGPDATGPEATGPEAAVPAAGVPASGPQVVAVSASGAWARLAAPYGSAYHRTAPDLGVLPR